MGLSYKTLVQRHRRIAEFVRCGRPIYVKKKGGLGFGKHFRRDAQFCDELQEKCGERRERQVFVSPEHGLPTLDLFMRAGVTKVVTYDQVTSDQEHDSAEYLGAFE